MHSASGGAVKETKRRVSAPLGPVRSPACNYPGRERPARISEGEGAASGILQRGCKGQREREILKRYERSR
jgi:hypothetical protein